MDFDKIYKGYLEWRLQYLQRQNNPNRDFDRHYFQNMTIEELIWFKKNFIVKTNFVLIAKEHVVEIIDEVINVKKEQRRNERIDNILGK